MNMQTYIKEGNSYIYIYICDICFSDFLCLVFCPYAEDGIYREGKRSRFLVDESDEDSEMEDALLSNEKNDWSFEDLCGEADIFQDNATSQTENGSWGLLNGHILARVFHFLKGDMKSLLSSATTCKHWNASVNFYRSICRHVDLSSVGPKCTDTVLQSLMVGLFSFVSCT